MVLSKEKISKFFENYIVLLPIIFAIAIIPLIVRITYYNPELATYSWFSEETHVMDMFMYCKNQAMMFLDGILVLGFIYLAMRKKLSKSVTFIPLGLYFLCVIFSSIVSVAPTQTWEGFYGMMESAFAVFGYCMICYYAYVIVKSEKQLKIVVIFFLIGVFLLGGIGISQFLGHDFYMTQIGKNLIFPAEYEGYKEGLSLVFGEGRVYASLYNPNYVGVYTCILIPLLLVLTFSTKKIYNILLYVVLIGMMLICLAGSGSKTAVLTIIPCMIFMIICFGKGQWKKIIPVFLISIIIFVGINLYQGETAVVSSAIDRVTQDIMDEKVYKLSDITLNDKDFNLTYNEEILTVKYIKDNNEAWSIEVFDSQGMEIKTLLNQTEDGYILDNVKYEGLEFVFGLDSNNNIGFSVVVGNNKFFIYYSETDETYFYTNYYGRATKLYSSETYNSFVFNLMGGFSGRGYIWSKSIPILKKTLILGSGPDTYAFMFPQYDYVSLVQNGWQTRLITKPHSIYLQTGIQTGVISLITFLIFNSIYIVHSFRIYFKRRLITFTERCGAAIFMAVIGFLIAGLVNDSTIGVSIIYWTLLGIGFACNEMIKKKEISIIE